MLLLVPKEKAKQNKTNKRINRENPRMTALNHSTPQ